jgi:hypothetical protein
MFGAPQNVECAMSDPGAHFGLKEESRVLPVPFCGLVVRLPGFRPRGPGFDSGAARFYE